jgi:hypothetical protein
LKIVSKINAPSRKTGNKIGSSRFFLIPSVNILGGTSFLTVIPGGIYFISGISTGVLFSSNLFSMEHDSPRFSGNNC